MKEEEVKKKEEEVTPLRLLLQLTMLFHTLPYP